MILTKMLLSSHNYQRSRKQLDLTMNSGHLDSIFSVLLIKLDLNQTPGQ
jgi:hypothetical protein